MSTNTESDDEIQINDNTYSASAVQDGWRYIQNNVLNDRASTRGFGGTRIRTPSDLQSIFGHLYSGDRDTWEVLGYDTDVDTKDYRKKYRRQDIARRIVELPAVDTWREPPQVFDSEGDEPSTEFETTTESLVSDRLLPYFRRADIAAGIGEFGLLFLGVSDNAASLSEPVNEANIGSPSDLAFMGVFAQDQVDGWQLGKDVGREATDTRFNKPVEYDIDFGDLDGDSGDNDVETVHWSRVIHIAEGAVESDLKGTPRLRAVYNRLDDLEKVVGSSAEMFWTGAAPRYQFDVRDGFSDIPDQELDELDSRAQNFVHDMEPYIKTMGMDINTFGGQEVDPSGVVESILKFVSGSTGIPKRKLVGSERGEQASTQDRANWFDQIRGRQMNYAEQQLLRPTVKRLISFGVLSEPRDSLRVVWPNLFSLTALEESEATLNRARALRQASPQGNTDLLPGGMRGVLEFLETGTFPEEEEAMTGGFGEFEESEVVREQFQDIVSE